MMFISRSGGQLKKWGVGTPGTPSNSSTAYVLWVDNRPLVSLLFTTIKSTNHHQAVVWMLNTLREKQPAADSGRKKYIRLLKSQVTYRTCLQSKYRLYYYTKYGPPAQHAG